MLKAFGSLMATAGVTTTPVVSHNGETDIAMVVLKLPGHISAEQVDRLREHWQKVTAGTSLEGVQALVLPNGMDLEIVRANTGGRGDG
jgi:hypothetical protein